MTRFWPGLIVALTMACGTMATGPNPAPLRATPSPDPALVGYRGVIDADMRAVNKAWDKPPCGTRVLCTAYLEQVRAATVALEKDVSDLPAPPALASLADQVKMAAEQLDIEISAAISEVAQPNSHFQKAATAIDTHRLDYGVAALDCWPSQPVNFGGEGDYSCG